MILGQLFHRYSNPVEFIKEFGTTHIVIGGIYIGNEKLPELIVTMNPKTEDLYIFENFSLPRRSKCMLPVNVFEASDSIFKDEHYKEINHAVQHHAQLALA